MAAFEQALQPCEESEMPIRAVFNNAAHPVQIYWAPITDKPDLLDEGLFDPLGV